MTHPSREFTHELDRATVVTAAEGGFSAVLDEGWQIGGGLNGGYVLALLGRAGLAEAGPTHPDPVAVSAHYLSASRAGSARMRTQVLRRGRQFVTVSATLSQEQDGRTVDRVSVLATYGDLGVSRGEVRTTLVPPELPGPEECASSSEPTPGGGPRPPLMERFDLRLAPSSTGWARGEPSGRGVIEGWFRFSDGREPDALSLLLVVDALPPATFDLGMLGWAPTLELTVHVRARPAPGWLRVRHETRNLADGLFEEDCVVWDSTDRLVAQSRQLALAPRSD